MFLSLIAFIVTFVLSIFIQLDLLSFDDELKFHLLDNNNDIDMDLENLINCKKISIDDNNELKLLFDGRSKICVKKISGKPTRRDKRILSRYKDIKIIIEHTNIERNTLEAITKKIKPKYLRLHDCKLTDTTINGIRLHKNIKELDFSQNPEITNINGLFKESSNLEKLNMIGCPQIKIDNNFKAIFQNNITELEISDDSLKNISIGLSELKKLQSLHITVYDPKNKVYKSFEIMIQKIMAGSSFIGLTNIYNVCYANTLIQSLYRLSSFKEYIYNSVGPYSQLFKQIFYCMDLMNPNSDIPKLNKQYFNEVNSIFLTMSKKVSIEGLITLIIESTFPPEENNVNRQHDIMEFFMLLSAKLEEEEENNITISKPKKEGNKEGINDIIGYKTMFFREIEHKCKPSTTEGEIKDKYIMLKNANIWNDNLDITKSFEYNLLKNNIITGSVCPSCQEEYIITQKDYFKETNPILFICITDRVLLRNSESGKNHSYFRFYEQIDLEKFFYKEKNKKLNSGNSTEYVLHTVIVHSGEGGNSGHYYCFIRIGNSYYKFNDIQASKSETKEDAISSNFGNKSTVKNENIVPYSAYVLVYIRKGNNEPKT